jgi:hypothetical protein
VDYCSKPIWANSSTDPISKIISIKKGGGSRRVTQVKECLPSKSEVLSSNNSTTKKKKEKEKKKKKRITSLLH